MGEREEKEAFVTLATNDVYAIGCLVLGHSLRRVKTSRQLVVMVTPGVTEKMRLQLQAVFHLVQEVDLLDSKDEQNLSLLGRPDLNVTFTKLHCWRLTQFQKAVFLDADTLVLQNVDELFDREELSAAPDPGWPDCFNSGVFVYKPSEETYSRLLQFALTSGSFDGGDQGLLNLFFNDWPTKDIAKHLPFIYNVVSHAFYSYLPAFRQFKNQIKIVHFIGAIKPWHHPYNTVTRTVTTLPETYHSQEFLQYWWDIFIESVHPHLDPLVQKEEGGLVGELAQMKIVAGTGDVPSATLLGNRERRLAWERGQADYLGSDRFENIQKKLDQKLTTTVSVPKLGEKRHRRRRKKSI
ncbi:glycogenin-1-like isoform X4 [Pomacea canaliculata]|uniref:glycogenin-1-like isoform X4 n=1 Tax=Pomacea canaliculata TaxID=400727 RepID=UPI000D73E1BA|nr:glycogenin-1-like isoform X4 [Pomacea canaliculata]